MGFSRDAGYPNSWMENLIFKIDDLGVPPFQETPIYTGLMHPEFLSRGQGPKIGKFADPPIFGINVGQIERTEPQK